VDYEVSEASVGRLGSVPDGYGISSEIPVGNPLWEDLDGIQVEGLRVCWKIDFAARKDQSIGSVDKTAVAGTRSWRYSHPRW